MVIWGWVGLGVAAFYGLMKFGSGLGKVMASEPPEPPSPLEQIFNHRCHYCDQTVFINGFIKRSCPNCKEHDLYYHKDCGVNLHQKTPHCNGVDVSHNTGHTINLSYQSRNMCAKCGLAKEHWDEWECTHSLYVQPSRRVYFSDADKNWLHSMKITTEEVQV